MKKAVVLLSGGLDSTTCLAIARSQGFVCHALSFSYGQRHSVELAAAKRVASHFGVERHHVINLDTHVFQGSALTDATLEVPDYEESTAIPVTYVPARNIIFLAMALGYAESIQAEDLFIGVSSVDYSHYPDCRAEFIEAFNRMAQIGTKTGAEGGTITIHAPLQHLNKVDTIKKGLSLGVDYGLTVSCYQANELGEACGSCDSCTFRHRGFEGAGVADPTRYFLKRVS